MKLFNLFILSIPVVTLVILWFMTDWIKDGKVRGAIFFMAYIPITFLAIILFLNYLVNT